MAEIQCSRCGRMVEPMPRPPTGGKTGEIIQQHVCADCWQEWIQQSTLLINHYGLVLADPDHRAQLGRMRQEFLNLPEG